MKTVEDIVSNIPNACVFSKLDAKSGFLQIKLNEKSSYLTTFNTPIGRYRWLCLPFGIKSAPEIFQHIMDQMLEGIEGAAAVMDDILIEGRDVEHHDQIFRKVIERATQYNLKLNYDKCEIRQPQVSYVGHLITKNGIKPDPSKVRALVDMPRPKDREGVRRFLGLVQYLAKFIPNLSQVDAPLRVLVKSETEFMWHHEQEKSFNELKRLCSQQPVLAFYDVNKPVEIQCDASKDGLGAVLIQAGRPVAYSSRSLSDTEKRYAQIEKEMLSIVHAATKFHCYIFGKETTVYNDHKPLEMIVKKPLASAPMRLQKMLLKLQWYNLKVCYCRGKNMTVADALSREYLPEADPEMETLENVNMFNMLDVTPDRYLDIAHRTRLELSDLCSMIVNGWPDIKSETPLCVREYWNSRDLLSVTDGIVFKGMRIVIPPSLRSHMLKLIHESHLGIVKCKQRAREVLYWPAMNAAIEEEVRNCPKCAMYQNKQSREPLVPTITPEIPYGEVGCDLFEFEQKKYLMIVDYHSRYFDAIELKSTTTSAVVSAMKATFSCHGIPMKLRSDNGPPFNSQEFHLFCDQYGIQHTTSSPHFQSSNGEAERAIQTVKKLWRKFDDKYLSLLNYRKTPLESVNLSPAQLLMGRRPRNNLPTRTELLKSRNTRQNLNQQMKDIKEKQKLYYDRRHVKELPRLDIGDPVRVAPPENSNTKEWKPATVVEQHKQPRSYVVEFNNNQRLRRNRKHLRRANANANRVPELEEEPDIASDSEIMHDPPNMLQTTITADKPVVTSSGRVVRKPERLDL